MKIAPVSRGYLLASGRNSGIRTHDLLVPNQAHYQAVLCPEVAITREG